MPNSSEPHIKNDHAVAVIGMSGAFAGAQDIPDFWSKILAGEDLLTRWTEVELADANLPEEVRSHADFVPVAGAISSPGAFDAEFFGFSRQEAESTDPQQRLLLEHCWTALEAGGYAQGETTGPVGVFVSVSHNDYRQRSRHNRLDQIETMSLAIGNDPDMAATRVSYKLGLTGPSMTVQTACSSSLVAVHAACQSLLTNECDMTLCGGASVRRFEPGGYFHRQGGIYARDGHCRPFDAESDGTLPGDGVGVVLLKRLEDAVAAGDHIHAVIMGTAVNNDGAQKAGFTAPSTAGQRAVIESALAVAETDPAEVGYVEAHGTATQLGDPIEFEALREVFGRPDGDCILGAVKGNVGHLDSSAGICGFIKTVLAVERATIPPTMHFKRPNAQLNMEGSGLRVAAQTTDWPGTGGARIAGVSSFGIGGTNAHVVVGQTPEQHPQSDVATGWEILPLAARTSPALEDLRQQTAASLAAMPEVALGHVAATLRRRQTGFAHRAAVVAQDASSAAQALREGADVVSGEVAKNGAPRPLIFVLPGQGGHRPGLGAGLYRDDPVFRQAIDQCDAVLAPLTGWRLPEVAFDNSAKNTARLARTLYAQPVVFSIGVALARCLAARGVRPDAVIGHSLGELTAACLAEVFSLEDALRVVARRAAAFEACAEGAMISVVLSEAEAGRLSVPGLSLACVNGENLCTLGGTPQVIDAAMQDLQGRGIALRRLATNRAFHTDLIDPALQDYAAALAQVHMQAPKMPVASNLTGGFLSDSDAMSPDYWVRQARGVVQFHAGITTLAKDTDATLLELGAASGLVSRGGAGAGRALGLLDQRGAGSEQRAVLRAVAALWAAGHPADLQARPGRAAQHRPVPLPTYPFQREIYMMAPVAHRAADNIAPVNASPAETAVQGAGAARDAAQDRSWDPANIWPDDPIAQAVARIWAEVLRTPQVHRRDDFFDLGGNSLMAIQIITKLRETHADLPMSALFDAPTVDLLADEIRAKLQPAEEDDELAALLKDFEHMDPDEIERLLAVEDD